MVSRSLAINTSKRCISCTLGSFCDFRAILRDTTYLLTYLITYLLKPNSDVSLSRRQCHVITRWDDGHIIANAVYISVF